MAHKWMSKAGGSGPSEVGRMLFVEAEAEDRCRRRLAASPRTKGDPGEQAAVRGRRQNHPYKS